MSRNRNGPTPKSHAGVRSGDHRNAEGTKSLGMEGGGETDNGTLVHVGYYLVWKSNGDIFVDRTLGN